MIGKYETLGKDAEYILQKVNAPDYIKFPEVVPSKTSGYLDSYLSSVPIKKIKAFLNIYYNDFKIFQYNFRDLV